MTIKNSMLPKVAIVGRPNTGKSTLFNILTDSRKAVVQNRPGVTRDLHIETCEVWGKSFDLIDTGGITESKDVFSQLIREQVIDFLKTADLLLLVMDGKTGLVPEDRDIVRIANEAGLPFAIIANKADRVHEEELLKAEFYEFGENVIASSFEQRRGVSEILEWLHSKLPENKSVDIEDTTTISFVGKPNAGKSSLCNQILGANRMLVSEIAGTTTDSIDSPFVYNNKHYTLVDTAGLRRSAKREDDLEVISAFKSQESIRRSQIVLLVVDAELGPTEQDAKIMQAILEDHKGVILVANKTDVATKSVENFRSKFKEQVQRNFHFFDDVSVVYTSAETGYGIHDLLLEIERVSEKLKFRVSTSELNDFFFETIRKAPAPVWGTTNVKFYYLTQTYQQPPAFIAFANHPDGVTNAYRRFLINQMKSRWDLYGIPIRIFCMKSKRGGESEL